MWSLLRTITISIIAIVSLHSLFHYMKDTLTPRKKKDIHSFELNKYKDIVDNLIIEKKSELKKTVSSQEDELLEDALMSLKNWEISEKEDETNYNIDFTTMERELTEYAFSELK